MNPEFAAAATVEALSQERQHAQPGAARPHDAGNPRTASLACRLQVVDPPDGRRGDGKRLLPASGQQPHAG